MRFANGASRGSLARRARVKCAFPSILKFKEICLSGKLTIEKSTSRERARENVRELSPISSFSLESAAMLSRSS